MSPRYDGGSRGGASAVDALTFEGVWNAATNTPTLVSGVGTKGDYYAVSVAGTTTLDGESNWGIHDAVVFNGTAWEKIASSAFATALRETDGPATLAMGPVLDGQKLLRLGATARGATRAYGESEGESTITGVTTFQQKLRVSLPAAAPAGTYRIAWNYTWRHSATNTDYLGRVQVDDSTTVSTHTEEPTDTGAAQRIPAGGFRELSLSAGVHNIDLDFATSDSGNTSGISQARVSVELVGP